MAKKTHLTLYVDPELVEMAKLRGINMSQLFEEVLRARLDIEEKTIPDHIKKVQEEIVQTEARLSALRAKEAKLKKEENRYVVKEIVFDR